MPKEKARPYLQMPKLEKSKLNFDWLINLIFFYPYINDSTFGNSKFCIEFQKFKLHQNFFKNRLALYVYEYLLHVGAQKAAQTFLSEVSFIRFSNLKLTFAETFFISDTMGKKYNSRRTAWFSTFLVVVSF